MNVYRNLTPIVLLVVNAVIAEPARSAEQKRRPGQAPPPTAVVHDTSNWFRFEFPLDDINLDRIDLSGLVDAPAGKHGFVTTRPDGHFYFNDGKRARFFGTNVGGRGCSPEKDKASVIAARLAKYGVNMLRLHAFDSPAGKLIDYSKGNSQTFNAETLDRIDFFIAELKKRGIYVYMDLLDYRQFRTADGVKDGDQFTHNWQGSMKGASIFDQRMIELQKDYATKLLTHRNPYTGLRYVDDPAIAVVETTNENGVFYFLRMADLSLPSYREELALRWNHWLLARYSDRDALARAWASTGPRPALLPEEDPAKGTVVLPFGMADRLRPDNPKRDLDPLCAEPRLSDLYRFFTEIQRDYYKTMHAHLRKIGVRAPIAGSNQPFFGADTQVEAEMNDFISRNQYWRHPAVQSRPVRFSNEAMIHVDIPSERNPLSDIASTSVAGKPQAVAEFNFPWPNEYRGEGWLMLTSVARAEQTAQGYGPPAKPRGGMSWLLMAEGRLPVLAEPVRARVRLAVPGAARVYALDSTGKRVRLLDAKVDAGMIEINPATARSIWCEVVSD